jgi:DNA invertase Pin-like site-specific DNA recombinase
MKMALLGYARVSTNQQKLNLQILALKEAHVREDRIFTDIMTGSTDNRNGLKRLLARAERDDTIICTKMDRMGRNTADMINIVDSCYKNGIAIKFLENGLCTEGTIGKMIIQILSAVAEAERERILERTNDGRKAAMAAGIKFGRKPHKGSDLAKKLISQNVSVKEVIAQSGISRATYFRLKKSTEQKVQKQ